MFLARWTGSWCLRCSGQSETEACQENLEFHCAGDSGRPITQCNSVLGSTVCQPVHLGSLPRCFVRQLAVVHFGCCRQAAGNCRLAARAPQSLIALRAKRFATQFHAQIFHPSKLILRSFFQLSEINSLEFWKVCRNRLERTPEKSFSCNSEGQPFNGLKQLDAVSGIAKLCPPEFFGQPRAGLADCTFFRPGFPNQITQLLLVGVNLIAQNREKIYRTDLPDDAQSDYRSFQLPRPNRQDDR